MTHEATFTPKQGHFKWYKASWQTEDAQLTGVEDGDELRFRVCIHDTGGAAGSNQDIDVEYSTNKSDWYTLAAQSGTDKKFRWRDDATLTEHASIDEARLSCTTENGLLHENACSNSEDVSASAHHEISIILEPYQPVASTTYYFRVVLEGTPLDLDDEVGEYANLQISAAVHHYQTVSDIAGLADSVAKVQVAHKTVSDISGLVDTVEKVWTAHHSVSDKAGLVDSAVAALATSQTATDLAGLLESVALKQGFKKSVADIAGLVDSVSVVHTPAGGVSHQQTVTDIAGLLDSVTVVHTSAVPSGAGGVWLTRRTVAEPHRPVYVFMLLRDYLEAKLRSQQ